MARLFLDTNFYIDLIKRNKSALKQLNGHLLFISPLSTHILFYTQKLKVPDQNINELQNLFGIIPLTKTILDHGLIGVTKDLEDNIQLHSAVNADCDYFLTFDKKLLKMKFFGKTKIVNKLTY